mmetsp:Transcript_29811/g.75007  ORF Transcript_29811/g.75007 Transcript_29811/m.75007 type:complete len:81 (+) Transcript_29811:183-425(+)
MRLAAARAWRRGGACYYRGDTALMDSSGEGYAACVSLLLERGAEVGHATEDGQTALMFASQEGHVACKSVEQLHASFSSA